MTIHFPTPVFATVSTTLDAAGDGVTDDTAHFVAALAAMPNGGELVVPPHAYVINQTLLVPSNFTMRGTPGKSKLIYGPAFASNPLFATYGRHLLTNVNNPTLTSEVYAQPAQGTILDHDVHFYGITFDMTASGSLESKAITLRCVDVHSADNCDFILGGDGIALIGCMNCTHVNCRGFGCTNAVYDNWAGSTNYRNVGCHAAPGNASGLSAGSAVLWNGLPGWPGHNDGLEIVAPQFIGGGIGLDTLDTANSTTRISIVGGKIIAAFPIIGRGQISNVKIVGVDIVKIAGAEPAAEITEAVWFDQGAGGGPWTGDPDNITVIGCTIDASAGPDDGNAVRLYGQNNCFANNKITGTYGVGLHTYGAVVRGGGNQIAPASVITVYGLFDGGSSGVALIDDSAVTVTVATGATVTVPARVARQIIGAAGSLAALTVVLPARPVGASQSVQPLDVFFKVAVAAVTWTPGGTTALSGAARPASVAAGTRVHFDFIQAGNEWFHSLMA